MQKGLDPTLGAILPLIGVVLGVLGSSGFQYYLHRRAERRGVRTMARLLIPELEDIVRGLRMALAHPHRDALGGFPRARWEECEKQLAESLDVVDWLSLENVYTSLRLFESEAEEMGEVPITSDDRAHIQLTLDCAADSLSRMRQLAKDPDLANKPTASRAYARYIEAAEKQWPDQPDS